MRSQYSLMGSKYNPLMEPEGLLSYSKEPETGLHSEPDECNPQLPVLILMLFPPPRDWGYLRTGC
jgi:hypothetical protein